jgi:two-component system, cell cycle response regulator
MPSRTLVIEDNPTNLQLMTYLLQAFGHLVIQADDGESGLQAARREKPDLIVCDVHLPGIDGYEVARQLNNDPALCETPLIAVTALAMVGDRDKVLAAGFNGYISKPINPETFVTEVEAFLTREIHPLPGSSAKFKPSVATIDVLPQRRRATILVVDDMSVNLELARTTLGPFGYEIVTANGVEETLKLARQHRPDMILSDVHMAGESGYDLIKAVKADSGLKSVIFVFLTSTAWRDADMATGLALGATDFITRPIDPRELLARIETCFANGSQAKVN